MADGYRPYIWPPEKWSEFLATASYEELRTALAWAEDDYHAICIRISEVLKEIAMEIEIGKSLG